MTVVGALVVVGATLATAPSAWADSPPPNDARAAATPLHPSESVTGTLVGATLEATNDESDCGPTDGSVWYRFTAPPRGEVVTQLDAGGEMDATVDVFKQVRSKLSFVDCAPTDASGQAFLDDDTLDPGATYVVRVGNQTGSVVDTFRLKVLVPTAPPQPPGRHLPARGIADHVDRVLNPGDAYWTDMVAGRTMRLSLRTQHCTSLEVFAPGTHDFATTQPGKRLPCGGYALYTPTTTGRHFLVVRAARDRDVQHYRLRVAPARRDDTTPGVAIANHARIHGSVNGGIDTRDLYRFDVTRRSALRLHLAGDPSMTLVRDTGRRLAFGSLITGHVRPGRYYIAVDGAGKYTLHLELRTITRSTLLVDGRHTATIRPTARATFSLRVRPSATGASDVTVERFDPISGWQFLRTYHPRVVRGSAHVRFHPPSIGRYRAVADYLGSHEAAPSTSGVAHLVVQVPLGQ
jgi:hypothetical protein